jgi:hypothetical protein
MTVDEIALMPSRRTPCVASGRPSGGLPQVVDSM